MDYKQLLNIIRNEFPDKAIDLLDSLELLEIVLDDTLGYVGKKVSSAIENKEYDKLDYYSQIAQMIGQYEAKILDIISIIDLNEIDLEKTNIGNQESNIPDYDKYLVDNEVEYSLRENFTHKRPYGFKLKNDELILTNTWQAMFLQLCKQLLKIDEGKIHGFEKLKYMNGSKSQYFASDPSKMRMPEKIADNLYIETNKNANAIRNLMIKMLKEYGYSIDDFKVYLKADYTDLNNRCEL